MNWNLVRELMRKDLQEIRHNGYVLYSMLFLPVIMCVIGIVGTVATVLAGGPAGTGAVNVSLIFSSIFILVPAIMTTLVGSTSVVIEKNNRSLEPLLATPITDSEFFAGKALAPLIPGVLVALLADVVYIVATDALTYGTLGYLMFPTFLTYIQLFFLIPVVGVLGTFAALIVSSKVKDIRSAQNISSLVVLPVLLLVYVPLFAAGQDIIINLIVGLVLTLVSVVLYTISVRTFKRENILVAWG